MIVWFIKFHLLSGIKVLNKKFVCWKVRNSKNKKYNMTDNNQFNNHFSYKFCPKFFKYSNNKILGQ